MQILLRAASAAVFAFLLLFAVSSTKAATRTSIASGDWQVPATWDSGTVPGAGDNVVIASGTTIATPTDNNIGGGIITVQSGAVLDLRGAFLTASKLIAENGSEVIQRGGTAPRTTISTYQLASNSTYTFNGSNSSLTDTHPVYGNLTIKPSGSSSGTITTPLTVTGTFTVDFQGQSSLRLQSNVAYSFGSLLIKSGVFLMNNSSGTATATVNGNLNIQSTAILRGTASSGHGTLNLGGDLVNNGAIEQDDGSSTGTFTVNLNGAAEQHISGASAIAFENLTVNNTAGVVLDRDVTVDKALTLTSGRVDAEDFALSLASGATVSGGGGTSYVLGYVAKDLTAAGNFTFPVGTNSGYSPVNVNVTSVQSPSKLSVAAFNGVGPGVEPANSVARFWNIIEEGDVTANLTFSYREADVTTSAAEASFSLVKKDGNSAPVVVCTGNGCIDAAANTASAAGVANFSRWAIGVPLAPSSAEASVTGRVLAADGRGTGNAFLTIVGSVGHVRYAISNQFGYFSFRGLAVGEVYTISIRSKQYEFTPSVRVITLNDAESHIDFTANAR